MAGATASAVATIGGLSDGLVTRRASPGELRAPSAPAGWSPLYGMLADRFGVVWVLDVVADYAAS